jgi:hypothetical protein
MPIEVLDDNNQTGNQTPEILPEIISQHQRYILGAKLESADFQFIPVGDVAAFAVLPEGAFFTDASVAGLNRVGRKIDGQRKYLAYEPELKAYVTEEIAKLKPVVVNPSIDPTLPTSTFARPLYAGQQIVFLTAGTVAGQAVEAGAVATVTEDIALGVPVTWEKLIYNGAGIQVSPIVLRDAVRLDGSAGSEGVTEKGIADAINLTKGQLSTDINAVDTRLTARADNLSNRIISDELRIEALESKPEWKEEFIVVGNGQSQLFKIALQNRYINTPVITWTIITQNGYMKIQPQDGEITAENGQQYLSAAFAGVPAQNQFRVSVQGLVSSTATAS